MSTSRLKTMILLVLLVCALCLSAVAIPNRLAQTRERRQMLAELKELYAGYALTIELDELPQEATLYSVELSETGQQTAAQALLGTKVRADGGEDRFETVYASEAGTLHTTRSGGFDAALTGQVSVRNPEKAARKLLRSMGFAVGSLQRRQEDAAVVFTAAQSLLGVEILKSGLEFCYRDGCLTAVRGTFYTGAEAITRVSEQPCISAADALTQLLSQRDALGWVGSSVTGLSQAYQPTDTAASGIRFVPVWIVRTDTGSFCVNAVTREVTARSASNS